MMMGAYDPAATVDRAGLSSNVRLKGILTSVFLLLVFIASDSLAAAQSPESSPIEISANAGYDGYYKGDYWVPVRVDVANSGPGIEGQIRIVTGSAAANDQVVYSNPISLPTQSVKRQQHYVYVPSFTTALVVEVVDSSGNVVASSETDVLSRLATDALLYGVVTEDSGRLEYLEQLTGGRSDAAVAYLGVTDLPETAAAWNALDVIIIHGADTGQLTGLQRKALEGWLDAGGQLVVSGGPMWQATTAGVADLLPVTLSGNRLLDDIPSLRSLAGLPFRDPGPYLATSASLRAGESLLHHGGMPLLARQEHGLGSVFFLALDPALAPLLDWDGSQALWSEVVGLVQSPPEWAVGIRNGYAAASAVTSLPSVALPAAWALLVFLILYVAVVGPLNYLVLRRIGRPELAWLTVPALVLVFSLAAYVVGFQIKGNDTIINQMSVAYGGAGGEQVRVQTLIGLYSPRRETYDLTLPQEAIIRPFEQGYGGLYGSGNIGAVERAGEVTVSDIRVDVGGVETLVADSYQPGPKIDGQVQLRTEENNVVLDIEVQNSGSTMLENAHVLFGTMAIPLGDLAPGNRIEQSERVSTLQTSPVGPSLSGSFASPATTVSPLTANMESILGSTAYYDDPEVYPRWQLLQALMPEYGRAGGGFPMGAATLIGWSEQAQLEVGLLEAEFDESATTLYFLELPLIQEIAASQQVVVPRPLLDWQVMAQNGVYDPRVSDLYLPPGWIELEFTPWPDYQSMTVDELVIVLQAPAGSAEQRLPRVQLWKWDDETWRTAGDPTWGRIAIEDPLAYIGPRNAVRIHLYNGGPEGIDIQQIYPELSGRVE